jgi:hypothetical protein
LSNSSQYKNVWYSAYLPMVASGSFDNAGNSYNVSRIINKDGSLNLPNYQAYSPLFLPASRAIAYGLRFASIPATATHILLYYHKHIRTHARRPLSVQPDIHARLMSAYKEVPDWWYLVLFCQCINSRCNPADILISFSVVMFIFGVVVIKVWETQLPVWAFVLAFTIGACFPLRCAFPQASPFVYSALVFVVPIGIIRATTNTQVELNVISELIIGYALPGRPIAMMMFKTWGFSALYQGLRFTHNLKLGHYMKVPPRSMFFCQIVTMVVSGTVQLGVQAWMFSNIEDLCSPDQKDGGFTCTNISLFGTTSIIVSCSSIISVAQHCCRSGVSLGRSACSRTVSFITASCSSSLLVLLHRFSNGSYTRSSTVAP